MKRLLKRWKCWKIKRYVLKCRDDYQHAPYHMHDNGTWHCKCKLFRGTYEMIPYPSGEKQ